VTQAEHSTASDGQSCGECASTGAQKMSAAIPTETNKDGWGVIAMRCFQC